MWVDHTLKVPDEGTWLAVIRVSDQGDTELVRYLGDEPEDVERELHAIQQRWTTRTVWPGDTVIQEGARIRDYVKYAEEDPRLLGVRAQIDGKAVVLDPRDVEFIYRADSVTHQ